MMPSGSNVVGISHSMPGTEPDPPPPLLFFLFVGLFVFSSQPSHEYLTGEWNPDHHVVISSLQGEESETWTNQDSTRPAARIWKENSTRTHTTRWNPIRTGPRTTLDLFFLFVHQCHWFSIRRRGNGFVRSENRVGFLGCWLLATTFEPISSLKIPTLMTSPRYRMFHNWTIEWTHRTRSCWFEWTECGPLFQINSFFSHVHTSWFF